MRYVIYKYPVTIFDTSVIEMPAHARVLHVGLQEGEPHIWVEVDPMKSKVKRTFRWVGTGHHYTEGTYIGTVQMPPFVWHLFEVSA